MINKTALAFFGGLCSLFAFQPFGWWPMQIVGLALLLQGLRDTSTKTGYFVGFGYGLALYLPLLKWSGEYVGALPWIALAVLQAGFVGLFGAVAHRVKPVLGLASLWVFTEALALRFPWGGFGWGRVAFSQADSWFVSIASIGGATLLSFTTVVVAGCLVYRTVRPLLISLLIPLALSQNSPTPHGSVRVAAVQGNVPRLGLDFNAQREAVLNNHIDRTATIAPNSVDLVVWPENASDVDPYIVKNRITDVVTKVGAPTLVGGVPVENGKLYNASILWLPKTGPSKAYYKQELAPFGEFMPLRGLAERIVPEARRVVDFTPGKQTVVFSTTKARVAPIICFEILNDGIIRHAVKSGAELLAVQTNSATFGRTPESAQQLSITRLRAIEHRRAIVSVSTSGISAFVLPDGSVIAKSQIDQAVVLTGDLPLHRQRTLAERLGGWSELLLSTLWFVRRRR